MSKFKLNVKGVAIIAGIIAIIVVVALLPMNSSVPSAPITDIADVKESVEVGIESKEAPTVSDSVQAQNEGEPLNYYIDENGIKHYTISVEDSPMVGG